MTCYTCTGYLWGLIALKKQLGITGSDVDEKIQNVVNEVLLSGRQMAASRRCDPPLMYRLGTLRN
jgi:hypothetical protein